MKSIIKKVEELEEAFRDPDEEYDVEWDSLSQEEKDKVIRGARVLIKHRDRSTDGTDLSNATEEELAVIQEGIAVLHAHAKPKGSTKKTSIH